MWGSIACALVSILVFSTNSQVILEEESELLMSIVIFREGDRTPLLRFENDPNNDKWGAIGVGAITEIGKKKMFEFGRYLRTRYHKTLVRRRITSRTIHVRSVKYERNMVTAQMVLNGLISGLPKTEIPHIPIHCEEIDKDKVMMTDTCPAFNAELRKSIKEKTSFNYIDEQEKHFYEKIEQNTKCSCDSFTDVKRCIDPLFCEASEGLKLPKWCNITCFEHMKELYDKDLEAEVCTPKLLNLKVQPFMEECLKRLQGYAEESTTHFQLFMYSAVEDTIPIIIQAFGVTNLKPHIPEFGASLFIEMRRVRTKKVISVFYKTSSSSSLKRLSIRGCGMECEFSQFVRILPPTLKRKRFAC